MAGNLGGFTDFTGIRVGSGSVVPGMVGSDSSVGMGLAWLSSKTQGVVAITMAAADSTTTTLSFPGAATTDVARAHLTSAVSNGLALVSAYVSSANVVTLIYHNSTTTAAAQIAHTVRVIVERWAIS